MTREEFYRSYVAFKSWPADEDNAAGEAYRTELRRCGVYPPARILEIGFGAGRFLDWARGCGYNITGVEIIAELVDRARAAGHAVFQGVPQSAAELASQQFDLIVAFDVFEHLAVEELVDLLSFCRTILAPGGRILARFPNGGSPFGIFWQNSDVTHLTALSGERMRQIALAVGLNVLSATKAARPMGGRRSRLLKRGAYLCRDLIERMVGYLYLGYRVPLDPNLTVVLGVGPGIAR
jgi:SAM-dependent methyltransferase